MRLVRWSVGNWSRHGSTSVAVSVGPTEASQPAHSQRGSPTLNRREKDWKMGNWQNMEKGRKREGSCSFVLEMVAWQHFLPGDRTRVIYDILKWNSPSSSITRHRIRRVYFVSVFVCLCVLLFICRTWRLLSVRLNQSPVLFIDRKRIISWWSEQVVSVQWQDEGPRLANLLYCLIIVLYWRCLTKWWDLRRSDPAHSRSISIDFVMAPLGGDPATFLWCVLLFQPIRPRKARRRRRRRRNGFIFNVVAIVGNDPSSFHIRLDRRNPRWRRPRWHLISVTCLSNLSFKIVL